jgi:hypothetical protein
MRALLYLIMMTAALADFSACGRQDTTPDAAEEQADMPSVEIPTGSAAIAAQAQAFHKNLRQAGWYAQRNRREAIVLFSDLAALLTASAAVSTDAVKEDLQFSASELTGLGERIVSGPPITSREISVVSARTYWAVAAFHQQQAANKWPQGNVSETAAHLTQMASFLDAARSSEQGPVKARIERLAQETRGLARRLEGEEATAPDSVNALIQRAGRQIPRFSNRVKQLAL